MLHSLHGAAQPAWLQLASATTIHSNALPARIPCSPRQFPTRLYAFIATSVTQATCFLDSTVHAAPAIKPCPAIPVTFGSSFPMRHIAQQIIPATNTLLAALPTSPQLLSASSKLLMPEHHNVAALEPGGGGSKHRKGAEEW